MIPLFLILCAPSLEI
jgi:hypothetical protein